VVAISEIDEREGGSRSRTRNREDLRAERRERRRERGGAADSSLLYFSKLNVCVVNTCVFPTLAIQSFYFFL
jgi:hypothetical protein